MDRAGLVDLDRMPSVGEVRSSHREEGQGSMIYLERLRALFSRGT